MILGALTGFSSSRQATVRPDNGWVTKVEASAEPSGQAPFDQIVRDTAAVRSGAVVAAPVRVAPRGNAAATIKKAHNAFEAVAMQVFVSSMLPNDQGGKFSAGSAGRMWKSVLVEKIAGQISASGRVRLMPGATFAKALNTKQGNFAEANRQSSTQPAAAAGSWQTTIETHRPSSGNAISMDGVVPTSNGE